jgi:hypothetical protein
MRFSDEAERNQTHLGWSNVGSNNRKNCRGDGMRWKKWVEKQEKCVLELDWHANTKKERYRDMFIKFDRKSKT